VGGGTECAMNGGGGGGGTMLPADWHTAHTTTDNTQLQRVHADTGFTLFYWQKKSRNSPGPPGKIFQDLFI